MRDSKSGIHAGQSFRRCSQIGDRMSRALALEAQTIVRGAAEPIAPGETVKAQMRRAWTALGRPPMWRLRAAWYGEAGSWSAAAFEDLRGRYRAWCEKQEREGRARTSIEIERLAGLRSFLAATDPDFHRDTIARLDEVLRDLGRRGIEDGARNRAGDF